MAWSRHVLRVLEVRCLPLRHFQVLAFERSQWQRCNKRPKFEHNQNVLQAEKERCQVPGQKSKKLFVCMSLHCWPWGALFIPVWLAFAAIRSEICALTAWLGRFTCISWCCWKQFLFSWALLPATVNRHGYQQSSNYFTVGVVSRSTAVVHTLSALTVKRNFWKPNTATYSPTQGSSLFMFFQIWYTFLCSCLCAWTVLPR